MQSKDIHSLLLSVSSRANGCYKQLSIIALKPWLQDAALKEMNAPHFAEHILSILSPYRPLNLPPGASATFPPY